MNPENIFFCWFYLWIRHFEWITTRNTVCHTLLSQSFNVWAFEWFFPMISTVFFFHHQLLLHFVVLIIHCFSSLKLMNECAKPVASHSFIHSLHLICFVFLILLVNNCRPVYVIRVKGEKILFHRNSQMLRFIESDANFYAVTVVWLLLFVVDVQCAIFNIDWVMVIFVLKFPNWSKISSSSSSFN